MTILLTFPFSIFLGNPAKLEKIVENLTLLEFETEESNTIWKVMAAILNLGELEYEVGDDGYASIGNMELVDKSNFIFIFDVQNLHK